MSDGEDRNREPADDRPEHAMTDDTDDDGVEQMETDDPDAVTTGESDTAGEDGSADGESPRIDDGLRRKLNYALLLGLGFLALIAVIQLYLNVSSVINQWVTREYRSLFQAVFNLVVLLVVGAAISFQVKRLAD